MGEDKCIGFAEWKKLCRLINADPGWTPEDGVIGCVINGLRAYAKLLKKQARKSEAGQQKGSET